MHRAVAGTNRHARTDSWHQLLVLGERDAADAAEHEIDTGPQCHRLAPGAPGAVEYDRLVQEDLSPRAESARWRRNANFHQEKRKIDR